MIAALFIDPKGYYIDRENVEPWGPDRDARTYAGPHPVVAHPPCHLWVNLAGVNFKRYGGPHNRPGNDEGCFCRALESVRKFGGVLEHPAGSFAWSTFWLPKPDRGGWQMCLTERYPAGIGYVCEVWQSAYGHQARKRTWLYYVGKRAPFSLNWDEKPGTHQVGWFDRNKPTLSKRQASATPGAFADVLIELARQSRGEERAA